MLDTPGEWYLDKSTGWLYYWPYNTSVENQKIVGATGKRAIEIVGDDIFTPVKNLSFEGLIIKMSNSYHQYKPWWGDDWDGMVYLENAEFITFNRCRLSHAGTNIFYLGNHIQNCQITNNMIEEFGNFGISGKGLYPGEYTGIFTLPQQAHIHKFNLIHNNRIRDGGRVVGSGSGIWLYHSGDNTITNNLIENMPRLGIHFYGQSWQHDLRGRTIYGIPVTWENRLDFNYTRNNYIAFNEMINCMYDAQDGGAYYTWGTGVNNVVENNFVHDMAGLADGALMGIYLDDATNFTTVRKNVVTRLSGAVDVYPFICKGQGNLFTNNVSANNDSTAMTMVMQTGIAPDPDGQEPTLDNAFFKNISYENGLDHTFLVSKPNWQDSYINEMISGCDDNLWYHPSGSYNFYTDWRTSRIWAEWLSFGMGTGSITVQDPLFSNPGNDDYSLQTGSPALGLGIESIDLSDVGLNDDFPF